MYCCHLFLLSSASVRSILFLFFIVPILGFPCSSAGKESFCSAGDPGSISREKIPWRRDRLLIPVLMASLVAQTAKNLPAMWETWVLSLGWEDSLEEGMATNPSILAWRRNSMDRGA